MNTAAANNWPRCSSDETEQLLGEFLVVLVEALFQCRVGVIDDLVQIVQRLGRHLELRGLVQVVLPLIFRDGGRGERCQQNTSTSTKLGRKMRNMAQSSLAKVGQIGAKRRFDGPRQRRCIITI